jgi:hypothetical protein
MKHFIFVLSCKRRKECWEELRTKYLEPTGLEYAIVYGDPSMSNTMDWDPVNKILTLKCEDDYDSLPYKTATGFRVVKTLFNPDGIFKMDDNTELSIPKFNELRKYIIDNDIQYTGKMTSPAPHFNTYNIHRFKKPENRFPIFISISYCQGSFYYVGPRALDVLCGTMMPYICKLEDYNVGQTLLVYGIKPTPIEWMYTEVTEDFAKGIFAGYNSTTSIKD